ncbi:Phospholipase/carboxylesterase [Calocera cornea HHB12733]|uniref:Acyl-protein thioesterase 1 n=1 Tax=Calocera cornea HHB12733 TaxID=1353952 RepID=A0A165CPY6_9BASI|nr:Phospholipase/carboxylesterase [Calocera cornea HHB12733]
MALSIVQAPRTKGGPWEIVPPKGVAHTATVIFLHGLGGAGDGWLWLGNEVGNVTALEGIKWVLPTAPTRAITVNMGQEMPGWYNVLRMDSSDAPRPEDEEGLFESVSRIHAMIDEELECTTIPSERIVVAGFSQGAALTLAAGLTYGKKLAGLAPCSGYLMCKDSVEKAKSAHVPQLPIFLAHGREDNVVGLARSIKTVEALKESFGYQVATDTEAKEGFVTLKNYDGLDHSFSEEEAQDFGRWLESLLFAKKGKEAGSV